MESVFILLSQMWPITLKIPPLTMAYNVFKVKYIIADYKSVFYAESKNRTHFFLIRSNFQDTSSSLKCIEQYYNSIFLLNWINNAKFRADIFTERPHYAIVNWKIDKRSYSWIKGLLRDFLLCLATTTSHFKHQQ